MDSDERPLSGSGKSLTTLHAVFVLGIRTAQAVTKIAAK